MKINRVEMNFNDSALYVQFEQPESIERAYLKLTRPEPAATLESMDFAVRALTAHGEKIAAIKLVRTVSSMGLVEAKNYVESRPPYPVYSREQ